MSTHNTGFYEDLTKIIFELSSIIVKYTPYFFCWGLENGSLFWVCGASLVHLRKLLDQSKPYLKQSQKCFINVQGNMTRMATTPTNGKH